MRTLAGIFWVLSLGSFISAASAEPAKMRAKKMPAKTARSTQAKARDELCEEAQRPAHNFNAAKLGGDLPRRMRTLIEYQGRPDTFEKVARIRMVRSVPATRQLNFSWHTRFGVKVAYNDGGAVAGGIVSLREIADLSLRADVESIYLCDGQALRDVIERNPQSKL